MDTNRDLQATHQIITFLERAKSHGDVALDMIPGLFAIVNEQGSVLRGNVELAKILDLNDVERLLECQLSELFNPEKWSFFQKQIDGAIDDRGVVQSFELDIQVGEKVLSYAWKILAWEDVEHCRSEVVTVMGQDVTEIKDLVQVNSRMEFELDTAQILQETLLPTSPKNILNCKVAGFYEAACECGGDWWHYYALDDKVVFWIGDVTGHGVGAALITSAARAAAALIEDDKESRPEAIVERLNHCIYVTARQQKLMTAIVATIDTKTGSMTYCRAGHEPMAILRKGSKMMNWKEVEFHYGGDNSVVGMLPETTFQSSELKLNPGDILFFYTDGIYEIHDTKGRPFSRRVFFKMVIDAFNKNPQVQDFLMDLKKRMNDVRGPELLDDDVTVSALQFNP